MTAEMVLVRHLLLVTVVPGLLAVPLPGPEPSAVTRVAALEHASGERTPPADHVVTGTVRTVDDTTLVLSPAGRHKPLMTFTLSRSLHRQGRVSVGAAVSVRYRDEGRTHVALAITVEQANEAPGNASDVHATSVATP